MTNILDTGASKSFMSRSHYLHCKLLHSLPKFASRTQGIQVGNGQFVKCFVHNTNNTRYTWTQIQNIYLGIRDT